MTPGRFMASVFDVPQGLKPFRYDGTDGTAKAVPLQTAPWQCSRLGELHLHGLDLVRVRRHGDYFPSRVDGQCAWAHFDQVRLPSCRRCLWKRQVHIAFLPCPFVEADDE